MKPPAANTGGAAATRPPLKLSGRARALRALRQIHGWLGLWGAALGLLFGGTGVLLNHRAVLKLPLAQIAEQQVQLPLGDFAPADASALARWLAAQLHIDAGRPRIRVEAARPVPWAAEVQQPAHWSIAYSTPRHSVQADYWLGNRSVSLRRGEANVFAWLNNLHKGVGLGIGWVLLVDSLAGSLIVLSLSGLLLWTQLRRERLYGLALTLLSVVVAVWAAGG